MFPNFTGNSRRTRNVNLSGQRAVNPFTNPSWTSSSPVGASKTVAHAQAERQQRQRERDRLQATLRIQRLWRAHQVRRRLRASRRQLLDQLYRREEPDEALLQRSITALPLLLSVFQTSEPGDAERLQWVARDLVQTKFGAFTSGAIPYSRMNKLVRLLIAALESLDIGSLQLHAQLLLEVAEGVLERRSQSLEPVLRHYYGVLGRCCQNAGPTWNAPDLLWRAVVTPLTAANSTGTSLFAVLLTPEAVHVKAVADRSLDIFAQTAYHEFAFSFLTQSNLKWFEDHVGLFADTVDMGLLSGSIIASASSEPKTPEPQSASLWLLAHFIALHRAKKLQALHPQYLRALYLLLCISSHRIREYFVSGSRASIGEEADDIAQEILPPYVSKSLLSLNGKDEISGLLERFTTNHGQPSGSDSEDAGFLAAYILTLVYCFPALADDIRMRLYLADIPTRQGPLPAVKFFWSAMIQTSVFSAITANEDGALEVLHHRRLSTKSSANANSNAVWHREWRTTLLFLELYIFVLRLTDDDDFFGGLDSMASQHGVSRLRSSSLSKIDLERLASFLKHLAFTLYYNAPETLFAATDGSAGHGLLDNISSPSQRRNHTLKPQTFVITAGIDFTAFRNLVTTAMKMLYERDSRRPFLPDGHWLMTSRFDMKGFEQAVLIEEDRRRRLNDEDDDDDDEEAAGEDEMDIDQPLALTLTGQRQSRHAYMERMRAQQKKAARERMLAANAPKLEILRNMPFVIPFENRVQIFREFVKVDMQRRRGGNVDPDRWRLWVLSQHGGSFEPDSPGHNIISKHKAEITRGRCFTDAMESFWKLEDGLKEPIQITFVDEFGMQEAGIDGGGVTKEFLTSVTQEAFTQDQRLFVTNSNNAYYPNPCAIDQQKQALQAAGIPEDSEEWRDNMTDLLQQYEFLGRIIGKCMYEGILINIVFARFFLLKWATAASDAYRANINDLRELDEELYQGMMKLKNYPGDVKDFDADFTITDTVSLPGEPLRTVTRNLVPNGENMPVTNENRPLYISYVARHRLMVQPHQQTRAFLRGLGMIIDPGWLSMFNQNELQRLVGGDNSEIDIEDLRKNTVYNGVYAIGDDGEEHPTVKLFWEVMHSLEDEERRQVLKYVTSTPRAPLLGFSQLRPAFSISDSGRDEERLPSASTCINLLKLPQYKTAETLKSKLLYAVKSGAGFDLS
ncbi:hypothetical protein B0T14DRAFT_589417 [Immersiella caudata]|uniref:HECT-type E3 ubiquitin transferase n=1 Tax=Immersiella caudata TaxID=314043 RepID=A0AA39WKF7_9PEZI|nr:hypothetical protein B0T14DRAFT_589417 [Immersiella caudata]